MHDRNKDVRTCYAELEFDGQRRLSGEIIVYGDVFKSKFSDRSERVEAGAFGTSVSRIDIILNAMHERESPIARSDGGGLTIIDDPDALRLRAELPDTTAANDTIELIKAKVLRGLSMEYLPTEYRIEENGKMIVIERATLLGVGVVDKPAFKKSRVQARHEPEEDDMDKAEITAMIEEKLSKENRSDKSEPFDPKAMAESIATVMSTQIEDAFKRRDDAVAELKKAEDEKIDAEKRAEESAEQRAEVILLTRDLVPKDFETRGVKIKDILVAAAGDEIKNAATRSEDYLQAKIEAIVERRSGTKQRGETSATNQPQTPLAAPYNVLMMPRKAA